MIEFKQADVTKVDSKGSLMEQSGTPDRKDLNEFLEGIIEIVHPDNYLNKEMNDFFVLVNEEGLLMDLPANDAIMELIGFQGQIPLVGNAIIIKKTHFK
ncbi:MAG: hypothetical protein KZQ70_09965 [gamma proteobacterium symbiont of Lucinoma myriamae]|nr:hypothetical protein [gamma proteobacterium symbiont of Lucinoma myriamae]MCU7819761.1 hypothetical protein [gamma proteobacterium symbiont of Lucinoma myriamae]